VSCLSLTSRAEFSGKSKRRRAKLTRRIYRFMAASKVLGEETIAGSAAQQQQQQRGSGNSDT
jgi:hypothetical protein